MASKDKGSTKKRKRRNDEDREPQLAPAVADVSLEVDDSAESGEAVVRPPRKAKGNGRRSREAVAADAAPVGATESSDDDQSDASSSSSTDDDRSAAESRSGVGRQLRNRVAALGEYGTAVGEYGRQGLTKARSAVQAGTSVVGRAAKDGYERSREITVEGWEAYPLAFCGAALAVGALAGFLLPPTGVEDKVMGTAADRVNARLREATGGLAEQGKTLVNGTLGEAVAATAREAEALGLTPGQVGQKVQQLAGSMREAVTEVIEKRRRG